MATIVPLACGVSAATIYYNLGTKVDYDLYTKLATSSLLSASYLASGVAIKPFPFKIYPMKVYGGIIGSSVLCSLVYAYTRKNK